MSSPNPSAAVDSDGPSRVKAPRAGWTIGLPDGWVAINRDELAALDEPAVTSLASRMNVEADFLRGFTGVEPFEAYAADPVNRREMRVVFAAQRLMASREGVEALIKPFKGTVDSMASLKAPAGNLGAAYFVTGGEPPSYGALLIGDSSDNASTTVVYLFAESPKALKGLVEQVAPKLALTT